MEILGESYLLAQAGRHAAHIHESINNPFHDLPVGCDYTLGQKPIPHCNLFSVGLLYLFHGWEDLKHRNLQVALCDQPSNSRQEIATGLRDRLL